MERMIKKRFEIRESTFIADGYVIVDKEHEYSFSALTRGKVMNYWRVLNSMNDKLKRVEEENKQLRQDVEYWKQVASQYSNQLNVFEHKHNEDKHIHWSSD